MGEGDFQQEYLEIDQRPYRNWHDVGEYRIDIASILLVGPVMHHGPGYPDTFAIHLNSGGRIDIEDDSAKPLRLNLINLLEDEFGRSGRLEDRLPITERRQHNT